MQPLILHCRTAWAHALLLSALVLSTLVLGACNGSGPPTNGSKEPEIQEPETQSPSDPTGIRQYTYQIRQVYPHDPQAWTQGLVYVDGLLLEGTGGGSLLTTHPDLPPSGLREVELATGNVLRSVSLDTRYFGEGITLFGGRIFQLTWRSRVGFIYDRTRFEQTGDLAYNTEGWGLTHDGTRLIMSDGTATITFRDPDSFAETGRIEVTAQGQPVRNLNELEYIEGEIWANVWQTDVVVRIDPETGRVTGAIDLSGLLTSRERATAGVLNGIAWDEEGRRIFVTGKLWPWLFEIDVVAN